MFADHVLCSVFLVKKINILSWPLIFDLLFCAERNHAQSFGISWLHSGSRAAFGPKGAGGGVDAI